MADVDRFPENNVRPDNQADSAAYPETVHIKREGLRAPSAAAGQEDMSKPEETSCRGPFPAVLAIGLVLGAAVSLFALMDDA